MVLTRRAYKAISRWLPNEVITQIIEVAPKEDQASLCRVSKLFHGLCLPVLCRTVQLGHYASASAFCSAIIANPSRGQAVRSLNVLRIQYSKLAVASADAWSELLISALKLMSRLESLSISLHVLSQPYRLTLLQLSFPRLLACTITPPYFDDDPTGTSDVDWIASFLALHPTLTRVHVATINELAASPPVRISLLNLQHYEGPAGLIPALALCGLREAQIAWTAVAIANSTNIDNIIRALNLLTAPEIPFYSAHEYYNPDRCKPILTSISTHMPHTRTLQMRSFADCNFLDEDTIGHIADCLPRFTRLIYLAMECGRQFFPAEWEVRFQDEDRITVEAWADACSTLEACCLNKYAWRKVNGTWEKFPMADFRALAGIHEPGY
ncbi:hypothetical protein FB451DRAFT_626516 [Mycena latifolia]|nr:hypothetical protein FB451DRAFT_626516 [Mycena latifolia]